MEEDKIKITRTIEVEISKEDCVNEINRLTSIRDHLLKQAAEKQTEIDGHLADLALFGE